MICPFCGSQIADDSVFCENCGNRVVMDPQTQQDNGAGTGSFFKSKKFIAIVACVVVVALVAAAIVPNLVLGKNARIIKAAAGTAKTGKMFDTLNSSALRSGDYTLKLSGEAYDIGFDASLAANTDAGKYGLTATLDKDVKADANFYCDKEGMKFISKEVLGDRMFIYELNGNNDGYIIDSMEDAGIDVDRLEKAISGQESNSDTNSKLLHTTKEVFDSVEFEKAGKASYTIDGKSRNCAGYKATITEDMVKDWLDKYEDALSDYADSLKEIGKATGEDIDLGDMFDEMENAVDDMDDVDLTVYLYKKQLAAVNLDGKNMEITAEFNGGNYPAENMNVEIDIDGDKMEIEKTGSRDGDTEKAEVIVREKGSGYKGTFYEYKYDIKTGDLEFSAYDDQVEIEGNLQKSGNGFVFTLDDLEVSKQDINVKGTITVSSGATFEKFEDKSDVYNIGTMSEGDWEDLYEDVSDDIADFEKDLEKAFN